MGYHHTAFATKNLEATHRFYTEAMGFELAKVITGLTPEGGWAKHVFYETGSDEYIAFWELHIPQLPDTWSAAISTGMGLPAWVNHLAFKAADLADLDTRRDRWLENGHLVMHIDHGFCQSIYTTDPNEILVEFCTTTEPMTEAVKLEALRLLRDQNPQMEEPKGMRVFEPKKI